MAETEKNQITPEIAAELMAVAGLPTDPERTTRLAPEIQAIRDSIQAMSEVDVTDIEPSTVYPVRRA